MERPNKPHINKINQYLLNTYGLTPDGRLKYKIVWSEDMFEWRKATVAKFDEHGNYLGEQEGTERRKKWNWINNRWLFLKWFPGESEQLGEIMDWDGYECIYCYQDGNLNYLEPSIESALFIMYVLNNSLPTTPEQERSDWEEKGRKEEELNREELAEAGKLREEESVGYTGKEFSDANN